MAHWARLTLALGLLFALPVVTGWSIAQAAQPASHFGDEPRSGLSVIRVSGADQPLMPGGLHAEVLEITSQVDSAYAFTLRLTSADQDICYLRVVVRDASGATLYNGLAQDAGFSGRHLSAVKPDWITVLVFATGSGTGLVPGSTITEAWAVTAEPN